MKGRSVYRLIVTVLRLIALVLVVVSVAAVLITIAFLFVVDRCAVGDARLRWGVLAKVHGRARHGLQAAVSRGWEA